MQGYSDSVQEYTPKDLIIWTEPLWQCLPIDDSTTVSCDFQLLLLILSFINQLDFPWSIFIICIDSIDCTVYAVIATGWSRWVTKELFLVALVPNFNQCPVLGSCYRFFSKDQYHEPYLVCRTEDWLPSSILVRLSSPRKSCQTRTLWLDHNLGGVWACIHANCQPSPCLWGSQSCHKIIRLLYSIIPQSQSPKGNDE